MSNPEKSKVTEEDIIENSDESDYLWSDEEGDIREIVLALPALRLSESLHVDENVRNEAVAAANLIVAAVKEAAGKADQTASGTGNVSGSPKSKKIGRPRVLLEAEAAASGSTAIGTTSTEREVVKKPRRKGSTQLTHLPQGPPMCNVCGKGFASWKAVFGHLRQHKDRGYLGFLPPPTFNAAEEGFGGVATVSSTVGVATASAGGGVATASAAGGEFGTCTAAGWIDLNKDPIEEEDKATGSKRKFDLNRSPPPDDEEEKDDKAE
ncbi:Zinc finger C2H2 superfamily [Arabidopsis suecica]|uniref:Zinc finger C2H2 superfamily n=1 Tax=Arabidopsis suecica TaxID=45249 RepID=A0A8T1YG00_ARASU|nr:Zinc finger C2H2 superfamily [Arabidopsis suecica]